MKVYNHATKWAGSTVITVATLCKYWTSDSMQQNKLTKYKLIKQLFVSKKYHIFNYFAHYVTLFLFSITSSYNNFILIIKIIKTNYEIFYAKCLSKTLLLKRCLCFSVPKKMRSNFHKSTMSLPWEIFFAPKLNLLKNG